MTSRRRFLLGTTAALFGAATFRSAEADTMSIGLKAQAGNFKRLQGFEGKLLGSDITLEDRFG